MTTAAPRSLRIVEQLGSAKRIARVLERFPLIGFSLVNV
jgi:hypothetical protein